MANESSEIAQALINIANTIKQSLEGLGTSIQAASNTLIGLASLDQTFNSMGAANAVMQQVGNIVPGAGPVWQGFNTMNQQAGQLGVYGVSGSDPTGAARIISGTATTLEKFIDILSKTPQATGGMGATAQERALTLEKIYLAGRENELIRKSIEAEPLRNDIFLEQIAIQANMFPSLTKTTEGLNQLAMKAYDATMQMDAVSKVTGQSRDQIAAETRERMSDIKVQLAMRHMTEEQKTQLKSLLDSTKGLGKPIQDVLQKVYLGARLEKEDRQLLSLLGESGVESAVIQMREAKSPEAKRAAAARLEESKADIVNIMDQPWFADLVNQAKGPIAGVAAGAAAAHLERAPILAQQQAMGPGTTVAQAQAALQQGVGLYQAGVLPSGELDPRQRIGREYGAMVLNMQSSLAGVIQVFDQKAIQNVDLYAGAMHRFNEALGGGASSAQRAELAGQQLDKLLRFFEDAINKITGTPGAASIFGTPSTPSGTPSTPSGTPSTPSGTPSTPSGTPSTPSGTVPSPSQQLGPPPGGSNIHNLNVGTFETFGSWFNDFGAGTLTRLHGNEAVVPLNQLEKFKEYIDATLYGKSEQQSPFKATQQPFDQMTKIIQDQTREIVTGLQNFNTKLAESKTEKFISSDDVAAKSFSTPRTKTVIKEPFNAADAMAMGLSGEMPRARTDEEDRLYKEWIMGGQVGPDPTKKSPTKPKESKVDTVKKVTPKPKEGKLVSPELQKILEEGESGKAYEVTGETAEELHKFMQAKIGKIKTPESGKLPSMSDLATKMQEGSEPVKKGLDAAAKVVPEVAGMTAPTSLGDVVGMLGKLHGTMTKVAMSSDEMKNYSRTNAKYAKKNSGLLI